MARAFENFLIKLGLYSNPFLCNFECWEGLTTKGTWFRSLWKLSWHLNVTIEIDPKYFIQPVRLHDKSVISEFEQIGFAGG